MQRDGFVPWWSEAWTVYAEGPRLVALGALSVDSLDFRLGTAEGRGQAPRLPEFNADGSLWRAILVSDDPAELMTVARSSPW